MNYKTTCIFILFFSCRNLFAQSFKSEIGIRSDNDAYLAKGSDKYYTDGLFLFYRHALAIATNSKLQNKVLGFEIGQKIFTPRTGSIAGIEHIDRVEKIDRPFAAYLYLEGTLNLLYKNESNIKLGAQAGYVGPNAFGRQVQTFVHKSLGFYRPSGWEYQVENDLELNLAVEYNCLLAKGQYVDLSLTSYANLGNGFTGAGLGTMVRIGQFNNLYNSISTQSTARRQTSATTARYKELFFYYKPQINIDVYDATVQGSMFRHKNDNGLQVLLQPNRFVLANQIGAAYSGKRFGVDAACIFHTKDVKNMAHAHQWGTISLTMHVGG